jgi:hypothetical protein
MTPQAVLIELLHRLKARQGTTVYIGERELNEWPADAVEALKSARLLVKARPASRLECPGCERQCYKPVELSPAEDARPARADIICDESEDMGLIPLDMAALEQWRVSSDASPLAAAQALGVTLLPAEAGTQSSRQTRRDAEIRTKYDELARAGKRNYVKEIQRTVGGAESLSDRRIRDIAKGR